MKDGILEKIKSHRQELLREFKPGIYTVIDYCKFSFNLSWIWSESIVRSICKILKVNYQDCDNNGYGTRQYGLKMTYDEGLDVLSKPRSEAQRIGVEDYFIVEMKGSACRYFEQRGGDWKELFTFLNDNKAIMHRVDVAVDDMAGIIDINVLSEKLENKCYTTKQFRYTSYKEELKCKTDPYPCLTLDDEDPEIIKTRSGWSATLGCKKTCQLQFYDKYAERKAKNIDVLVKNWLRCELRFYDYKAQNVLPILYEAFNEDNFPKTAMHLLGSVIEIKDDVSNFTNKSDFYKAKTWMNWSLFIEGIPLDRKLLVPGRQESFDPETAVTSRMAWAERCWPRTLTMMRASFDNDQKFYQLIDELTLLGLEQGKINNQMIQSINRFALNELGLAERKKEDIIRDLMKLMNVDPSRFEEFMAVGNVEQSKNLRIARSFKDYSEDN